MGYLRHETIIVSGWGAKEVETARAVACEIFARHGLAELVSPIVPHAINGGAAFFVAPDGSKVGWRESQAGDAARGEFLGYLNGPSVRDLCLDWMHLLIGGDDGEYRVLASPELVMED